MVVKAFGFSSFNSFHVTPYCKYWKCFVPFLNKFAVHARVFKFVIATYNEQL